MQTSNPFRYTGGLGTVNMTAKQLQENANFLYYELMGKREELSEYDRAGKQAPFDLIADVHTLNWSWKEESRSAKYAREKAH